MGGGSKLPRGVALGKGGDMRGLLVPAASEGPPGERCSRIATDGCRLLCCWLSASACSVSMQPHGQRDALNDNIGLTKGISSSSLTSARWIGSRWKHRSKKALPSDVSPSPSDAGCGGLQQLMHALLKYTCPHEPWNDA